MKKGYTLIGYSVLIMLIAMVVACASAPRMETPGEANKVPRISAEELKGLIDGSADITVVDTMPSAWYEKGHIKGAINFPWREPLGEPVSLPRITLLIIYCDCPNEETSADVAEQLTGKWNYENVKVLMGGWSRWVKLGYPTETSRLN